MPDDILFIGHSLVGPVMPAMYGNFLAANGSAAQVDYQVINGSPIWYNWENGDTAEGVNARLAIPAGDYRAVIVTEAIPLNTHLMWSDTEASAKRYADLAYDADPQTQFYIYETWHNLTADLSVWRAQLDTDLPKWEGIANYIDANAAADAPPTLLVPAGQAMARLYDAIEAGDVPGITSIEQFFSDDIHLNDLGHWFLAGVQAVTISGLDPADVPLQTYDQWGGAFAAPDAALAAALGDVIAQALNGYGRDGRDNVPLHGDSGADGGDGDTGGGDGDTGGGDTGGGDPDPDPPLELPAGIGFGLSEIADWVPNSPFLDVFKTSRPLFGHQEGRFGGVEHDALVAQGVFDEDGWPTFIPDGLYSVGTLILTELPADMVDAAGRYHVRWDGAGEVELGFSAQNVTYGTQEAWFDYVPDGTGFVSVDILSTETGNHVRNLTVVKEEHVAAHDAGQIFNPKWLDIIDDGQVLRFMDWMETNGSTVAEISDMPRQTDATWAHEGVPLEVMIALANQTGIDPWFNIPHLATPDYIEAFVTQVRDGLAPGLKAYFEFSNEVWNFQFAQSQHALAVGGARFDGAGDAWVQNYAADAVTMARIIDDVYGANSAQVVKVLATHTGWTSLENSILNAPLWVAEDPATNAAPHTYFDAYAVTGYFDGGLGRGAKGQTVLEWIGESQALAESRAADLGLSGAAAEAYVAAHRYDLATERAVVELTDGSLTGDIDGSLLRLQELFAYHANVATQYGLELVAYEGGSHVVGVNEWGGNAALTDFFTHLNYTPEMGALYQTLFEMWEAEGGSLFAAFTAVDRPSQYGSWGHLRHLDDSNPRMAALREYWGLDAAPAAPSGAPQIIGTLLEGQMLFADISDVVDPEGIDTPTVSYQWLRDDVAISGATSDTYLVTRDDADTNLRVEITYQTNANTARDLSSAETAPIAPLNAAAQGVLQVAGLAVEDATLTVDSSAITDADGMTTAVFAYQWLRDGQVIEGATADSYQLGQDDVGHTLSVRGSFTDDGGTAEDVFSGATLPVENINDAPAGQITIAGALQQGETLIATLTGFSDPDGNGPQGGIHWLRDGIEIAGAMGGSYVLGQQDVGARLTAEYRYTDAFGTAETLASAPTLQIENINDSPVGRVMINGVAQQGEVLRADLNEITDLDGMTGATLALQWMRDGVDINGASGAELTLTQEHVGAAITVRLTYTDDMGAAETVLSAATAPVENQNDAVSGSVSITGAAEQGGILTADATSITDVDGIIPQSVMMQWMRDGVAVTGATGATYVLTQADVGATLSARYSHEDGFGVQEMLTSAETAPIENINDAPVGGVAVAGTAVQGAVLAADLSAVTDADGLDPTAVSYQWARDGVDIAGATGATFALGQPDVGAQLSVRIEYVDGFGTEETLLSSGTNPVGNINDLPDGGVTLSGQPIEGAQISATSTVTDLDGIDTASLRYEWLRGDTVIEGATTTSYTLVADDIGTNISLRMTYLDLEGTVETVTSATTDTIENRNDAPVGTLAVAGEVQQGQTLTVDATGITDLDGFDAATATLQWLRDGDAILGATAQTYVLTQADVGAGLSAQFSYTDFYGAQEQVTWSAASTVENVNDTATGALVLEGLLQQGDTLTVLSDAIADVDGIDPDQVTLQWFRDGTAVNGATTSSYTLGQSDVGAVMSLRYQHVDGYGATEEVWTTAAAAVDNRPDAPTGSLQITGAPLQGATLTVDASDIHDLDGITPGSATLHWMRDGSIITGADAASYTLTQADVGAAISVTYGFRDMFGDDEEVRSSHTGPIININDAAEGQVVTIGAARAGQSVTALGDAVTDIDGFDPANATWSWFRALPDGDETLIAGATTDTLALTTSDEGSSVFAQMRFVDGFGSTEILRSDAVHINQSPTADLTINGLLAEGETLTLNWNTLEDPDGYDPAAVGFEWLRDGEVISGAASYAYVPGSDDVGQGLSAAVVYTDFNGIEERIEVSIGSIASQAQVVRGTAAADTLIGTDGDDTIFALDGDDVIAAPGGRDIINGGAGFDTLVVNADADHFMLGLGTDGLVLTDRRENADGGQDVSILTGVEAFDFGPGAGPLGGSVFDVTLFDGAAEVDTADFTLITELYIAYFNRAPDALGLYYWATQFTKGFTLEMMADSFFQQLETRTTYADVLSADGQTVVDVAAFVTSVYANVLGRAPDAPGFEYWTDQLANNAAIGPANFIMSVLSGAKFPSNPTQQTDIDQAYLATKAQIGTYFAAQQGMSDIDAARAVMALYDGTPEGILAARALADDSFTAAMHDDDGGFLFPLIGVVEDPFADL